MTIQHPTLLSEIEAFLSQTGMGASYFGKMSAGNSELVARLKAGGRIWPETEVKVRAFIRSERKSRALPAPSNPLEKVG